MRILHVYKTYYPDDYTGVPRFIHSLAESTSDAGCVHSVLAPSPAPSTIPLEKGNQTIYQVKNNFTIASTSISYSIFRKFRGLSEDADIIHYHFPWPLADLLHLTSHNDRPSLITYHSDVVKQKRILLFYRPLMLSFLRSVHTIVATSPNYLASSRVLSQFTEKTRVIPIGLPERPVVDDKILAGFSATLGSGFLLFIGALRYYKGIHVLLEAARRTGLPVVIAGKHSESDIDISKLPSNVIYIGEVTEAQKEALLMLCKAFVFPSHVRSEAFGIALVEAARAAKPMISCEIGTGTSYINIDQRTGIVVPPNDPAALAAAMEILFGCDDLAERMGGCARQRYENHFRSQRMAEAYLNLYEDVLRHNRK